MAIFWVKDPPRARRPGAAREVELLPEPVEITGRQWAVGAVLLLATVGVLLPVFMHS